MKHSTDSTMMDTFANTTTITGVLAFIMKFTPIITALVLVTALTLNIIRIVDWFRGRNDGKG